MLAILLWGTTGTALVLLVGGLLCAGALRQLLRVRSSLESEIRWIEGLMRLLALLSLFGVLYAAVAIAMVPSCMQLR